MIKAHKIRLYPNNNQESYFKQACGVARFAYNWALDETQNHYKETGKCLSGFDLQKELTNKKKTELSWIKEVSSGVPRRSIINLSSAFLNFFKKKSRFPKYKKKGKCKNSFYLQNNTIKLNKKRV